MERAAVRAVIRRDAHLLMVHSRVAGDYKFPGGGLEPGESAKQALVREVSEECGRTVTRVGDVIMLAVEHRRAREPGAIFRMESTYHPCDVGDEVHDQRLDATSVTSPSSRCGYRHRRGDRGEPAGPRIGSAQTWVTRETAVLRALRDLG